MRSISIQLDFKKWKVKFASQVFSHSVAAGTFTNVTLHGLPTEAAATAEFVETIDKIFDCCNSLCLNDFAEDPFQVTHHRF